MNDKTIAFYIGSLSRGGAEHVMVNLAAYFYSRGYKVYLVTKLIDEPEYEVPDGVTRILADITDDEETNSRVKNLKNRIKKLENIWKEIRPDIIVSFIRKNNLMAIASSRGLNIPVVVGIRSNPERELQGKAFKALSFFLFRFATGIVMQTSAGVDYLPAYLRKKAVVMPNSVDERIMDHISDGIKKPEIALVGRIDENKNQKMVLEVFYGIADNYPEWSLHLYGDGEKRQELEQRYGSENIVFHGTVENVAEYLGRSEIFVLPSKQEGMPNALIEAMALNAACISTDCPCGGPADLIEHDKNGILIRVDDKEGLKEQLIRLMSDTVLRENLGREAGKIRERLSPQTVNKKWEEYIQGLIKS